MCKKILLSNEVTRNKLESLYEENGCTDCRLHNLEDLKILHNVDATQIKGFDTLTTERKQIFIAFIVNYFNAYGLDTRLTLIPLAVYYVHDQEFNYHYIDEYDGSRMATTGKRIIKAEMQNGKLKTIHQYIDKQYSEKFLEPAPKETYLRFEYKINSRPEWMHVISEKEWY